MKLVKKSKLWKTSKESIGPMLKLKASVSVEKLYI